LGSPEDYKQLLMILRKGDRVERHKILEKLVDIHYTRNDFEFSRGTFRVRGDVIEVIPAYEEEGVRIELFGNEIQSISIIDILTGKIKKQRDSIAIYPAKHYVTTPPKLQEAIRNIKIELAERLDWLRKNNKLLEAQRLEMRTNYDLEMMQEIGSCSGIENYSRHLTGRKAGERPFTLLDFFPKDFLMFIDESHQTIPQVQGMYHGDRSRKETLVEHGFRLPSALDNRPLNFHEFEAMLNQVIFVSATPAAYELEKSGGIVVEQIIRPTGLIDPEIEVRPIKADMGVNIRYLHSEIAALDRVEILRDLRLAEFDVLVGINLLREGLDLPEVSLVAVLDADKEGFLRSETSLMQTAGRAARNVGGKVIFYADTITQSMQKTIDETNRRRKVQQKYNDEHGITPRTIYKSVEDVLRTTRVADEKVDKWGTRRKKRRDLQEMRLSKLEREELIELYEREMTTAAKNLEFERAAELRDEIELLKNSKEG
jgi:excinuclease ABC subunit B